jgi:hypothetical protein
VFKKATRHVMHYDFISVNSTLYRGVTSVEIKQQKGSVWKTNNEGQPPSLIFSKPMNLTLFIPGITI